MKIIVDSNRVISSLIKNSTTREILFNKEFQLFAPENIKSEIEKYKEEIIRKSSLSLEEFEVLFSLVIENVIIVPKEKYERYLNELRDTIKDPDDVAYLAVCSLINADGIWSHDPHFKEQDKVKVFTNIDMLKIINKGEKDDFVYVK